MTEKIYETPQMTFVTFETEEIITTSSLNNGEIELPDLDLDLFLLP